MILFIFLGLLVGFLVGLTGVGGGALMTPSLILLGVEPTIAVGTDLLYSTVTRIVGGIFHYKKGNLRLDIVLKLLSGGIPAILIGSFVLRRIPRDIVNEYLTIFLGIILIITSALSLLNLEINLPVKNRPMYLYLLGFIVGLTIQFTSVGAGVIVSFVLMNVMKLDPREVVGVAIFYGLAISSLSFLNYLALRLINYNLAFALIIGTVPGVYLGTHLNNAIERKKLRRIINLVILIIGVIIILT
ncbi:Predicted permease [Pyrococcus sp. NA2]|uniref:sulfite exporter TauE/SafE family protein n=1 Tax=Pyrococcus sp. (strain NA2) TaxID=342949 RepID=UPI000209AA6D|nr:sulfite exporter TauE/SafE family protein [Pyrococcus sp. NA2]AEC51967.1 Predicted permease [Pyrococcus sp. NA2]